jgi:hypothetical protein
MRSENRGRWRRHAEPGGIADSRATEQRAWRSCARLRPAARRGSGRTRTSGPSAGRQHQQQPQNNRRGAAPRALYHGRSTI